MLSMFDEYLCCTCINPLVLLSNANGKTYEYTVASIVKERNKEMIGVRYAKTMPFSLNYSKISKRIFSFVSNNSENDSNLCIKN